VYPQVPDVEVKYDFSYVLHLPASQVSLCGVKERRRNWFLRTAQAALESHGRPTPGANWDAHTVSYECDSVARVARTRSEGRSAQWSDNFQTS
jgi:hypothetical protein